MSWWDTPDPQDPELLRRQNQRGASLPEISGPRSHGGWPGAIAYGVGEAIGKGADMAGQAMQGTLTPQAAAEGSFDVATAGLGGPSGALAAGSRYVPALKELIKAYHGSPHDFDRFDINKIGTGEGAQVYGHGLYFAENPKTAQHYRDQLSQSLPPRVEGGIQEPDKAAMDVLYRLGYHSNDFFLNGKFNYDQVAKYLRQDVDEARGDALHAWEKNWMTDEAYAEKEMTRYQDRALERQNTLDWLHENHQRLQQNPGRMYEVGIHADPQEFLRWDQPIGEQRPVLDRVLDRYGGEGKVNEFYRTANEEQKALEDLHGGILRARINDPAAVRSNAQATMEPQYKLGEMLDSLDMPASSWHDPTRNITGQTLYRSLGGPRGNNNAKVRAAKELQEVGVPGVQYLDQGSRSAGTGTYNYVTFNDDIVEILKKYGIAGLALLPQGWADRNKPDDRPRA